MYVRLNLVLYCQSPPPQQEVVQSGTTPLLVAEENKDTISVEKEHPNAEVVSVPSTETDVAVTFSNDIPPARSVRDPPSEGLVLHTIVRHVNVVVL